MAAIIALLISLGLITSPEEATDEMIQGIVLSDDFEQM